MQTKILNNKRQFIIIPTSPFHFNGTFHKPSHFPDNLSAWESNTYWQTIRIDKKIFGIKIENKGKLKKPKVKVSIFYDNSIS